MLTNNIFRLLCLSLVVWGAAFYSSIESTVAIWNRSETFAHCFIILPICIYLIRENWSKLRSAKIEPNLMVLPAVVAVLILWLFGNLAQLLVIEQGAAFLMLPMIIWTLMGNQVSKILIFTMFFWMFSVPVGEFLIPQLQDLTADITVWSLQMTGVPVYREGLYLAVPNGLFEVAVACSGIRYLIASFTLGSLFAYLNYQSNKKRLIFILFSLALPLLANGIRAYGIVMIAYLSDMKYATGVDHLVYGWLFFGLVIFVMFAVGSIWSDPVVKMEKEDNELPTSTIPKVKFLSVLIALVLLVGSTFVYKNLVNNPNSDFVVDVDSLFIDSQDMNDESWLPIFENANAEMKGHSEGLDYFVAYYKVNVQGQELINSNNKMFNVKKWSIEEKQDYAQFKTLTIINIQGRKRLLAYTYVTPWLTSASSIKIKLSQAFEALSGRPQLGMLVMLSVPVKQEQQDTQKLLDAATSKLNDGLQDFLDESK
ncbi:exosortase A [Paraglaciecola arctica]|nr:exosortase A [Paraglaciecola arctica]